MGDRRWSDTPRWEAPALAAVACIGVTLRFVRLDLGWFGVDQARDVATALDIVGGRSWPLIGPTMRRVTRLGALYHYFWALPYLLWHDPIAGYWFAACLSTAALVVTWHVARRLWGPIAGVVTAAVAAVHPVWVIDGRIYWAPAALPFIGVLVILMMLEAPGRGRIALVGGLLGLAVQLHLTMAGWVAGVALLVLADRVPPRMLVPGIAAGTIVGAPALWAMIAASAATESGLGALATRAPHAPLVPRLIAVASLPARVLAGLGRRSEGDATDWILGAATAVLAVVVAAGLLRLVLATLRGDRGARVVLVPGLVTTLLVLSLPGDAWYYYLDSALPLWALAAGALVGTRRPATMRATTRATTRARHLGAVCAFGACALFALSTADWLRRVAAAGYMPIAPAGLTLDGRPGRDAASAGRVTTLAVKRRAGVLAASLGGDFAALWHRVHGPALADATGDNGFWFRWSLDHVSSPLDAQTAVTDRRHLAFWYDDDPTAIALAAAPLRAEVERTRIGPLLAVRYPSILDYDACRADGAVITVPIRVPPDPRRYGDGTPALPPTLPSRVVCARRVAAAGRGERRIVAALGGAGTVALVAGGRSVPPARVAELCITDTDATVELVVDRRADAPAELDLYDVPLGVGCDQSTAAAPSGATEP